MPSRRTRKTQSIVTQAVELACAVPQVVAYRVTRMAVAGPTPSARDRKEFQRMGAEKMAAFGESWNAMTVQALHAHQTLAASFFRAFWSPSLKSRPSASAVAAQVQNATLGVLSKGMAPMHRKAVANAKRLARAWPR